MTSETCVHCTAPVSNGVVLCSTCRTTTTTALANIATYHGDLLSIGGPTTRGRRRPGAVSDPTGGAVVREDTERDPADYAAAETRNLLATWTRALMDEHPGDFRYPADTVADMAAFLGRHVPSIATLGWVEEFVRQVLDLERRLRRIVERGKGRWYAGICSAQVEPERPHDGDSCGCACHQGEACDVPGGCGPEVETIEAVHCDRDLYAVPGSSYVRCPRCGAQHPVAERRNVLLTEAHETKLPLSVIANVCVTLLDEEPSVGRLFARLRKWASNGSLVWADNDGPTRLYRVGDVLELLTRHAADPRGWARRAMTG